MNQNISILVILAGLILTIIGAIAHIRQNRTRRQAVVAKQPAQIQRLR